jgi:glutathione S-transferase
MEITGLALPMSLLTCSQGADEMIEVFARRNASNVLPVMWTLGELQIPHVRHDLGGSFGGAREPGYLAMNPNGRIPTIKDGDFVLWESNAIVRYLCRRYDRAGLLLPATEDGYALADQWMDWYKTTLYPPYIDLFWAIVRTEPSSRDHARITTLRKARM